VRTDRAGLGEHHAGAAGRRLRRHHGGHADHRRAEEIQFSASYAAMPAYFAVLESSDLAAFQSELERAQLDRIESIEQAALDALERAFGGRIVDVQMATPPASFLEAYLGDVVEIR
jgi:octopine/nopaline transport system substrate-binding protein